MVKKLIFLFLLMVPLVAGAYPKTPNIDLAPGHICTSKDKDFSKYRYDGKVAYCKRNVSYNHKNRICKLYGVNDRTGYTVDHVVPLSAGGSNDSRNLWCQSRRIYTGHIEYWLYKRLEDGKITQAEAVRYILAHKFNPKNKDHIPRPPR